MDNNSNSLGINTNQQNQHELDHNPTRHKANSTDITDQSRNTIVQLPLISSHGTISQQNQQNQQQQQQLDNTIVSNDIGGVKRPRQFLGEEPHHINITLPGNPITAQNLLNNNSNNSTNNNLVISIGTNTGGFSNPFRSAHTDNIPGPLNIGGGYNVMTTTHQPNNFMSTTTNMSMNNPLHIITSTTSALPQPPLSTTHRRQGSTSSFATIGSLNQKVPPQQQQLHTTNTLSLPNQQYIHPQQNLHTNTNHNTNHNNPNTHNNNNNNNATSGVVVANGLRSGPGTPYNAAMTNNSAHMQPPSLILFGSHHQPQPVPSTHIPQQLNTTQLLQLQSHPGQASLQQIPQQNSHGQVQNQQPPLIQNLHSVLSIGSQPSSTSLQPNSQNPIGNQLGGLNLDGNANMLIHAQNQSQQTQHQQQQLPPIQTQRVQSSSIINPDSKIIGTHPQTQQQSHNATSNTSHNSLLATNNAVVSTAAGATGGAPQTFRLGSGTNTPFFAPINPTTHQNQPTSIHPQTLLHNNRRNSLPLPPNNISIDDLPTLSSMTHPLTSTHAATHGNHPGASALSGNATNIKCISLLAPSGTTLPNSVTNLSTASINNTNTNQSNPNQSHTTLLQPPLPNNTHQQLIQTQLGPSQGGSGQQTAIQQLNPNHNSPPFFNMSNPHVIPSLSHNTAQLTSSSTTNNTNNNNNNTNNNTTAPSSNNPGLLLGTNMHQITNNNTPTTTQQQQLAMSLGPGIQVTGGNQSLMGYTGTGGFQIYSTQQHSQQQQQHSQQPSNILSKLNVTTNTALFAPNTFTPRNQQLPDENYHSHGPSVLIAPSSHQGLTQGAQLHLNYYPQQFPQNSQQQSQQSLVTSPPQQKSQVSTRTTRASSQLQSQPIPDPPKKPVKLTAAQKRAQTNAKKAAEKQAAALAAQQQISQTGQHPNNLDAPPPPKPPQKDYNPHNTKLCLSCRNNSSVYWRDCWTDVQGRLVSLCNSCGLRYKKCSLACNQCLSIPYKADSPGLNIVCKVCSSGNYFNPNHKMIPLQAILQCREIIPDFYSEYRHPALAAATQQTTSNQQHRPTGQTPVSNIQSNTTSSTTTPPTAPTTTTTTTTTFTSLPTNPGSPGITTTTTASSGVQIQLPPLSPTLQSTAPPTTTSMTHHTLLNSIPNNTTSPLRQPRPPVLPSVLNISNAATSSSTALLLGNVNTTAHINSLLNSPLGSMIKNSALSPSHHPIPHPTTTTLELPGLNNISLALYQPQNPPHQTGQTVTTTATHGRASSSSHQQQQSQQSNVLSLSPSAVAPAENNKHSNNSLHHQLDSHSMIGSGQLKPQSYDDEVAFKASNPFN